MAVNVIDFIRESAKFMVTDRPDVYDHQTAVEELSVNIENLRRDHPPNWQVGVVMFTSYVLMRIVEDEGAVEEFILSRKLSSATLFEPDHQCRVYSHTDKIDLPSLLDSGQDDVID